MACQSRNDILRLGFICAATLFIIFSGILLRSSAVIDLSRLYSGFQANIHKNMSTLNDLEGSFDRITLSDDFRQTSALAPDFMERTENVNVSLKRLYDKMTRTISNRLLRARRYRARLEADFSATIEGNSPLKVTYRPPDGGLGNFMFEFATFIGIARKNGRTPVIYRYEPRMELFEGMRLGVINQSTLFPNNTIDGHTIGQKGPGIFTPELFNLSGFYPNETVAVGGYGQSWKYFHHVEDEIKSMFTFKEGTLSDAQKFIFDHLANVSILRTSRFEKCCTLVGVHVRRGDILFEPHKSFGNTPATDEYLLRSVLKVQAKYKPTATFIFSNDLPYCRSLFRTDQFIYVNGNSAEKDMALMTFMDVMVLSVGTYGWWGAYLGEAKEVYYYEHWPRNGSSFRKSFNPDDYFLPYWIAGD